jgi:hypothetical protein
VPKRNYGFEKRQKEISRQQKQEEKRRRRGERNEAPPPEGAEIPPEAGRARQDDPGERES